uniref:Leucine rich repeats-containing protein n=1 Tax=Nippostrongylus brasiliensis TaxID=27835 RepID=A0A0N4YWL9_NIPBR
LAAAAVVHTTVVEVAKAEDHTPQVEEEVRVQEELADKEEVLILAQAVALVHITDVEFTQIVFKQLDFTLLERTRCEFTQLEQRQCESTQLMLRTCKPKQFEFIPKQLLHNCRINTSMLRVLRQAHLFTNTIRNNGMNYH